MDMHVSQRLQSELSAGEKLLWSGRPDGWLLVRQSCAYQLVFALVWTGAVATMLASALGVFPGIFVMSFGAEIVPVLFLGLMFALGAAMVFRQVRKAVAAFGTVYGLTDRRAIIVRPGSVSSYHADDLSNLNRSGHDGRGSVFFRPGHWVGAGGKSSWVPGEGFVGIDDPRQVERLIRERVLSQA